MKSESVRDVEQHLENEGHEVGRSLKGIESGRSSPQLLNCFHDEYNYSSYKLTTSTCSYTLDTAHYQSKEQIGGIES